MLVAGISGFTMPRGKDAQQAHRAKDSCAPWAAQKTDQAATPLTHEGYRLNDLRPLLGEDDHGMDTTGKGNGNVADLVGELRSDERRVGKECVSAVKSWWA